MKRKILAIVALAALAGCQTAEDKAKKEDEITRVLMIGNSFSISCMTHLPKIAADCGEKLDLCSLYIGGCSLEKHVKNVRKELAEETKGEKGAYRYDRSTCGEPTVTLKNVRLTDALKIAQWDVVTIQQASHLSWKSKSYEPWGDELIATIRRLAPQAKIVVHQTWSYTPFDARLRKWNLTQDQMFDFLSDAYGAFAKKRGLEVIPFGLAVQAWRRALPVKYTDHSFGGDVVGGRCQKEEDRFKRNADLSWSPNSDTFHLNEKGEYFQALVWAKCLLGVDLDDFEDRPVCVTEDEDKLMRRIAKSVAKKEKKEEEEK
jgi:hypothetical protein